MKLKMTLKTKRKQTVTERKMTTMTTYLKVKKIWKREKVDER